MVEGDRNFMKLFSKIMTVIGIWILLSTCIVLVLGYYNIVELTCNIKSVVFCSLGLALLCYAPRKYIKYTENEKESNELDYENRRHFKLQISAGIILIVLSYIQFIK